ncbi:MAG: class I SAM-dependent methyltransferase [Blastocatellia bacterium]|nr:class I SAM-dependent methyltransferase [Blastocatellia bacterium]
MTTDITSAITAHQDAFGLKLNAGAVERLAAYYDLVMEANPLVHLVGPSSAEEFAIRHLLESLTLLKYLPNGSRFADVGTGAGLPSIPCLIVRDDLSATLIESKKKKADFLTAAITQLALTKRAAVVNRQFEEAEPGHASVVTCRAIDKFPAKLPKLLKWAGSRIMILFAGPAIIHALQERGVKNNPHLLPMSEQRFIIEIL